MNHLLRHQCRPSTVTLHLHTDQQSQVQLQADFFSENQTKDFCQASSAPPPGSRGLKVANRSTLFFPGADYFSPGSFRSLHSKQHVRSMEWTFFCLCRLWTLQWTWLGTNLILHRKGWYLIIVTHQSTAGVLGAEEAVDQHGPAHWEMEANVLLEITA